MNIRKKLKDFVSSKNTKGISSRSQTTRGIRASNKRAAARRDLSSTRVLQGPKIKQLSSPTAKEAGNKLIQAGKAAPKPKPKPKAPSPVMASRQRALEARRKRAAEKAKEKKLATARPNDSEFTAKQRTELAKLDKLSPTLARNARARFRRKNQAGK